MLCAERAPVLKLLPPWGSLPGSAEYAHLSAVGSRNSECRRLSWPSLCAAASRGPGRLLDVLACLAGPSPLEATMLLQLG